MVIGVVGPLGPAAQTGNLLMWASLVQSVPFTKPETDGPQMAMLHNLKVYLGLGPDEEYDDSYLDGGYGHDDFEEPVDPRDRNNADDYISPTVRTTRIVPSDPEPELIGTVRPIRPVRSIDEDSRPEPPAPSRPSRTQSLDDNRDAGVAVRPVRVGRSKPRTIEPSSFADAKIVADEFSSGTPVVINMTGLSKDLSRRLIDFASGVCYVEGGTMKKLARGVFLVTPKTSEVSDEELRRLEERGYRR